MKIIEENGKGKKKKLAIIVSIFALVLAGLVYFVFLNNEEQKSPEFKSKPTKLSEKEEGPVIYHYPKTAPIDLILIEKATQKLFLYRYDGDYKLIKTYACSTGESEGDKLREEDRKTPEGIYFNTESYIDTKVTIFGDRAFGINYPNPLDSLEGKNGYGIFIHGTNRQISPFSTRGCISMNNGDLADLDNKITIEDAVIIIGEKISYKFKTPKQNILHLIPLLKTAMIPSDYSHIEAVFDSITLYSFENTVTAVGKIKIKDDYYLIKGTSRLYLSRPAKDLMVMIKREWTEDKEKIVLTKEEKNKNIEVFVENWRKAWESKDIEKYISMYHRDFEYRDMDLEQFKLYKESLNHIYEWINVKVSDIDIKAGKDSASVCFKQIYHSDKYRFEGYKVLYLKKDKQSWKITQEVTYINRPLQW